MPSAPDKLVFYLCSGASRSCNVSYSVFAAYQHCLGEGARLARTVEALISADYTELSSPIHFITISYRHRRRRATAAATGLYLAVAAGAGRLH